MPSPRGQLLSEILAIDWKTVCWILLSSTDVLVQEKYSVPIFHQMMWKHLSGMKLSSDRSYWRKILNKSFVSN